MMANMNIEEHVRQPDIQHWDHMYQGMGPRICFEHKLYLKGNLD